MTYHYEINSLIELLTAIAAVTTVVILWKYRSSPGVRSLIYLELSVTVWALSYAFEFGTSVLDEKILWSKISYFGIAYLPVLYFLFTSGFSQKQKWIKRKYIIFLSVLPTAIIPLVFTNQYHHLIWTNVTLDEQADIAHYFHGPGFWVFYTYTEILIIAGLYNLLSSVAKYSSYYRSQIYTLVIGSIIPVAGNLVYVTGINPFPGFDWTPVSFVVTGFIIAFGVIRYRIFDLIPIARNKLLDRMNDSMLVINTDGIVEDYNRAALELASTKDKSILRKPFEEVFIDFKDIVKDFDPDEERKVELQMKGEKQNYDILITPLRNITNKLTGHLVIFHDITQLKETEKSILETNKQLLDEIENKERLIADLDAFAHTVAHDIKNPLSAIVSSISLLPGSIQRNDSEMVHELVDMLKISANKSIHITNELLTLSSVRQQNVRTGPLDISEIFTEAKVRMYNILPGDKVHIQKAGTWPKAIGYAAWIEEVWYNYLSNAVKYGGNPPHITVGADDMKNGYIRFWIKDNGNGIPPEDQSVLFNQFTKLNPETGQGHGLGLSIVRRIIEKLGGEVGVESTGVKGVGSLFYFTLPASES